MNEYFEKLFPKKPMTEILTAYEAATGLHTELIDEKGDLIFSVGEAPEFCRCFSSFVPQEEGCIIEHIKGGREAMRFGDTYTFTCHSGLYLIAFPIISNNIIYGSIVSGPFLMDEPDTYHMITLQKRFHFPTKELLDLSNDMNLLKVISADQANQYGKLLYYLVNGMTTGNREILALNNQKLSHQSKINEAIQSYKNGGEKAFNDYPFEKENELITCIRSGDISAAKAILNDLLAYILLHERHDIRKVRVRIIELCSLLSRTAIEEGGDAHLIMTTNDKMIQSFIDSEDVFEISFSFMENIEMYTNPLFVSQDKRNKPVKKAAEYISQHFSENITLADIAESVNINPSYLSSLFKQVTGTSVKEYLNKIRIREAEYLLKNTDYSIMDIAVACGFNDQSYFTKVFKSITGATPKQYR